MNKSKIVTPRYIIKLGGIEVKVCIIGSTGHIGYVFERINNLKDIEIAGVAPSTEGENIDRTYSISVKNGFSPVRYDNYINMLDDIKPDITVVASYFCDHARVTIEALKRGSHIFVEKPVAVDLEELNKVESIQRESGRYLCSMFGLRYSPHFNTAWRAVKDGKIGRVRLMNAQKSYKLGNRPEYYKKRSTYGGTIPWVGSHAIDWLYWFSGEIFKSVYANHTTMFNKDNGEMEMSALCHFVLSNDVYGSVNMDFLRPESAPTHGDDRIRIAGTEGVIEVRHGKVYLINNEVEGEQELVLLPKKYMFEDFVKQVRGEAECIINAEDTFAVTRACLLARQSADENRVVEF